MDATGEFSLCENITRDEKKEFALMDAMIEFSCGKRQLSPREIKLQAVLAKRGFGRSITQRVNCGASANTPNSGNLCVLAHRSLGLQNKKIHQAVHGDLGGPALEPNKSRGLRDYLRENSRPLCATFSRESRRIIHTHSPLAPPCGRGDMGK